MIQMKTTLTHFGKLLIFACVLACMVSLINRLKGFPFIPEGPAVAITEATKSLWESGSLSPKYFTQVKLEGLELSKRRSCYVTQDVFSLGENGSLYPKHSLFSVFVAIPFYALFGEFGFWILQLLFFILLIHSTYRIVHATSGKELPWSTLLGTCLLSQTLFYTHIYSYDLHACAILIGGLCLSRKYPCCGAAIMNLAILVRPSNVLLSVPLAYAWCFAIPSWKRLGQSSLGISLAMVLIMTVNRFLFGQAFTTTYTHIPAFANGTMVMYRHPLGFDTQVFLSQWSSKLFGQTGLLPFNLALVALPFVVIWTFKAKTRSFLLFCNATALLYSIYIFSYPMWTASFYGNKFLLPAIYLYLFSFIEFLGRAESRFLQRNSSISSSLPSP